MDRALGTLILILGLRAWLHDRNGSAGWGGGGRKWSAGNPYQYVIQVLTKKQKDHAMNELNLKPSPEAPEGFAYVENHVRAQIGLSKDDIRALRQQHLTEGTDWVLKKKRVWLSRLAVEKLLTSKGLGLKNTRPNAQPANADDPGALKSPALPMADSKKNPRLKGKSDEPLNLIVVQVCKNPRLIQACALDDNPIQPKTMVRVRVRSNENFRRQMVIPVTPIAGYDDMFDLARPCPKKPGKW